MNSYKAEPAGTAPFELSGRVAAITGAASGFGLEIARGCARAGMKLVLADIDAAGLAAATSELSAVTSCVSARTDVRMAGDLEALSNLAFETFGAVHVLFNNAGVVLARPLLETSAEDWRWMLDVNLNGVINGVAAFAPKMLRQGAEGRIVNTASAAGFLSVPDLAAYCVSKHGVVVLSEVLHQELQSQNAALGVTILCPAFVPTGIIHSDRARPQDAGASTLSAAARAAEANLAKAVQSGRLTAADVARLTLEGVRNRSLYVFTHQKIRNAIEARISGVYGAFAEQAATS